jgi:hypothetical protein
MEAPPSVSGPLSDPWASRLSHHTSAAELVRSMTRANRVDATHIRTVLAHVEDERGVLEALLDHPVLKQLARIDIDEEAWTVEAFACQLVGTSFHGLTFSLHPNPDRPLPRASALIPVEPGDLSELVGQRTPEVVSNATFAIYDTARRSVPIFDGTTIEEFLIELPRPDPAQHEQGTRISFRDVAVRATGLARSMGRPLSFLHAPAAVPRRDAPRGVTGLCLRFGVAFPQYDDSQRLSFGTRLVSLCCDEGYGLWQASRAGNHAYDYWEPVVPLPSRSGDGTAGYRTLPEHGLAVTCIGPARPGTTEVILRVLEQARAPLIGVSETWVDDITMIHLFTQTRRPTNAIAAVPQDLRADTAVSRALGLPEHEWVQNDMLRDYRVVVSPHPERQPDTTLAALWLGWTAPATSDALRLAIRTLQDALDTTWARYRPGAASDARDGHLNIEYLVCREAPSVDRVRGRMRVAVDPDALGVAGRASGSRLGEFCSDVERHWRSSLSFALGTPRVELDVVWRESWLGLGRWMRASQRSGLR